MARKLAAPPHTQAEQNLGREERARQAKTPLADRVSMVPNAHVPAGPTNEGSGETVYVALKLDVAWFELQHCEAKEFWEQGTQGGRWTELNVKCGPIKRVRGTAYPRGGQLPEGFPDRPTLWSGYSITAGFDKAFWDEWVRQHHQMDVVVNQFIMADTNRERLKDRCRERAAMLTGIEPLNPKGDERDPRPIRPNYEQEGIKTEDDRARRMKSPNYGADQTA